MMALRQSSLIFVVARGLKAADWVMELFPLEAAFAGRGVIADSAVSYTHLTLPTNREV